MLRASTTVGCSCRSSADILNLLSPQARHVHQTGMNKRDFRHTLHVTSACVPMKWILKEAGMLELRSWISANVVLETANRVQQCAEPRKQLYAWAKRNMHHNFIPCMLLAGAGAMALHYKTENPGEFSLLPNSSCVHVWENIWYGEENSLSHCLDP